MRFILLLVFFFPASSTVSSPSDWRFQFDLNQQSFKGLERFTKIKMNGSYQILTNNFMELSPSQISTHPQAPSLDNKIYIVGKPGDILSHKGILKSESLSVHNINETLCPQQDITFNWVFMSWNNNSDPTSTEQAMGGEIKWQHAEDKASIDSLFNFKLLAPSWFKEPIALPSRKCKQGQVLIDGPGGTDRAGVLSMGSDEVMIYHTESGKTIVGFFQNKIANPAELSGRYTGFVEFFDSQGVSTKPIEAMFTETGTSKVQTLVGYDSSDIDKGDGVARFDIESINAPRDGFIKAKLIKNKLTADYLCIYRKDSHGHQYLYCAGNDETDNTIPANLYLHSKPEETVQALHCNGTGPMEKACYINDTQVVGLGEKLRLQHLVIQKGGKLQSSGPVEIEVLGKIKIESGGLFEAETSDLVASELHIQRGGKYHANSWGIYLDSLIIDTGASLSADALGERGGVNGGTGGGASAGQGSSTSGGGGGSHGGLGGAGQGAAGGALVYGSVENPWTQGSGGGGGQNSTGGAGGGVLVLKVRNQLVVNGTLSANGQHGASGTSSSRFDGAGGGAGGSILIVAQTLMGRGQIEVQGGAGGSDGQSIHCGGGGSGGRLAIYSPKMDLKKKQLSVEGGISGAKDCISGAKGGEKGTLYYSPHTLSRSDLLNHRPHRPHLSLNQAHHALFKGIKGCA